MTDKIDTDCPECGGKVRFTLEDLAKQRTVRCSRGHQVQLRDQGGGARQATKALSDLEKAIQRLGR